MTLQIQFLGAAGTVTGSKYVVTTDSQCLLVDCGMFQGDRQWREKNWSDPAVPLNSIQAVLLTHAHIDHIGMLPRFVKLGLDCPVFCTKATADLARIILLDSARLQEEEALYRLERGRSRHKPPLPLYTEVEARRALEMLRTVSINTPSEVLHGTKATWSQMGHILGACAINLDIGGKRITFSGDIGRYSVPILQDPAPVQLGDLLLIESTYGDRLHDPEDPKKELATIINEGVKGGGSIIIPSFAVGRTQTILYYLRELKEQHAIPNVPVVVDSPMADDATAIYVNNPSEYDNDAQKIKSLGKEPFLVPHLSFVKDRYESMKLNSVTQPMIIISASGMLTGGRILHHLKHHLPRPNDIILFVGFQPPGSRGDWLKKGSKSITVLGDEIPVRAKIRDMSGLSAHGDRDELIRWCKSCQGRPGKVAVVHGEPESAQSFRQTLQKELGWDVFVAEYLQKVTI